MTIEIYCAGHTEDYQAWLDLRVQWLAHKLNIISSWPDLVAQNFPSPNTPAFVRAYWQVDIIQEATRADCLICWTSFPDKPLRGALVEIGAALGHSLPVFIIGEHHQFEASLFHHPLVTRVPDFEAARRCLMVLDKGWPGARGPASCL